jgi:hypothetical protein
VKSKCSVSSVEQTQAQTNGWPKHVMADVTIDAQVKRLDGLVNMLVDRGNFSREDSYRAIDYSDPDKKEAIARWLSAELKTLRKAEATLCAAPVRFGKAMSRLDISDLAQSMLEALNGPPGDELLSLLQELLNVDRHRKQLACSKDFDAAAGIDAQLTLRGESISARKLARMMGVSQPTISAWRKSTAYNKKSASLSMFVWKMELEPFLKKAIDAEPTISGEELFRAAFKLYNEDVTKKESNFAFASHT